jgi:hypothetical protein
MSKLTLSILFFFLSTALQAQITFEKVIDALGAGPATCIQETFDGGYVLTGMSLFNGNDMLVLKLDSICNIEWHKIYGGSTIDFGGYIEQSPDSGYMVNGSYNFGNAGKNWLLRLDANGDTIWTKKFSAGIGGTNSCENNSMASINNSIYGMTGTFQQPGQLPDIYFQSCLNNGFLLSNKIYPTPFSSDPRAINKTFDGGFVITGEIGITSTAPDIYVIRTNAYGDTIWTKKYHKIQRQLGQAVVQTNDSGFALVSILLSSTNDQIYLIKTDGNGDTTWTKTYDFNYRPLPKSLQQTDDGGYIIVGESLNINFERSIFLIKTNAMGDTLWSRQFKAGGTSVNNFSYNVRQTKDKGYILCGVSTMAPTGLYIIKTDSLGLVYSTTGIPEVNNPFSLTIYPNPNSGVFTLNAKGIAKKCAPFKIYNANNQCVYSSDLLNNSECSLNLSYLPNGLYFIVLYTDNKVFSRKFIIHE